MKDKFLKLSLYLFVGTIVVFIINYFVFHFVTDNGITLEWQSEAGKPFVSNLIGQLGVLMFFGSILSLIVSQVFYKQEK